jgi:hypothetical protein
MVEIIDTLRPVWIMKIDGALDAEGAGLVADTVRRMHEDRKSLLIVQATRVAVPNVSIRTRLGELFASRVDTDLTPAVSILVDSMMIRGAVTAIMWAVPGQNHVKVVKDAAAALDHLQESAPDLVPDDLRERALVALGD